MSTENLDVVGASDLFTQDTLPDEPQSFLDSTEEYGPASGGTHYTDSKTIKAVQRALVARGYSVGPKGVDGKYGKDTEAALFKFSGKHGPPDEDTLAQLGVAPGGGVVTSSP